MVQNFLRVLNKGVGYQDNMVMWSLWRSATMMVYLIFQVPSRICLSKELVTKFQVLWELSLLSFY